MAKKPLFVRITEDARLLLEAEKERSGLSQSAIVDLAIKFLLGQPRPSNGVTQPVPKDLDTRITAFISHGRQR